MSLVTAANEIEAKLREIPHVDVYRGYVSSESLETLLANSDSLRPIITVSFGGLVNPATRVNGIVGAAQDSHLATITVRCIASTDADSMTVWGLVWDKLIGFVPTNCGELEAALFGGTGEISSLGSPVRYASVQVFSFLVNADN